MSSGVAPSLLVIVWGITKAQHSRGSAAHCVGIVGQWIFDTNKKHAVRLNEKGLDMCCLGSATFKRVCDGFQLVRRQSACGKRKRQDDASDSKHQKIVCAACQKGKETKDFARNQLRKHLKGEKAQCKACKACVKPFASSNHSQLLDAHAHV